MATKIKKRRKGGVAPIPKKTLDALQLAYSGTRFLEQGESENAERAWHEAVRVDAQCALAWSLLTDFYENRDRKKEAVESLRHWIATCERKPETLFMLANRSCALKEYAQGRELAREALRLDSSLKFEVDLLIAKADQLLGDWEHAILTANEILKIDPKNLVALKVRYYAWYCLGWVPEEIADHRRYLELQPDIERHSRLLFMLNYAPDTTPELVYEESVHWSNLYAEPLVPEIKPHRNKPDPERRLKVAYISPDLRTHAIMKLLPAVFEKHDDERFEIFAYSVDTKEDQFTQYVKETTKNFVHLPLSRQAIAERVSRDEIDILVDLAGHTMHTDAYLAFATKPAPIQVSWLGILSTTGLRTMDYFVGDAYLPCPGTEHLFTEKVYRLPRPLAAYRPPGDPGLGPPPCLKNGYITFGCFNDPRKITADVAKVWAILLHLNPGAKLILKYQFLEREICQRRIRGWFAEYGISMDRLIFEGKSKAMEYLGRYNTIDIALDPFPYNGGTTTFDTLWMGVPLVSLCGRLAVACSGASNLSALGLPVAKTIDEYISLANQLARDMPNTPRIRQHIREALIKSPLMDEVGLVRALEDAYRDMWRTWCATQQPQSA